MYRLLLLVAFVVPAAVAQQGPIPVNSQTQDYVTPVTQAINNLVTNNGASFLSAGTQLLTAIGIIMLVVKGPAMGCRERLAASQRVRLPGADSFLPSVPDRGGVVAVLQRAASLDQRQCPPALSGDRQTVCSEHCISTLNQLLGAIQKLLTGEERPSITDPLMIVVYYGILFDMVLVEGVLFALNILSFVMVGIGSILGPLFIPWLMVQRLSWLFWNWLQFMLQYSFFQVIASALTNVWATVLMNFWTNAIHGDHSLAHLAILLVPLGLLNVGFIVCIWKAVRSHPICSKEPPLLEAISPAVWPVL